MLMSEALFDPVKGPIYRLSLLVLAISVSMGSIANAFNDNFVTLVVGRLMISAFEDAD